MKTGKLLSVVVAFMMVFALLPTAVHGINPDPPPMYVWVAEEWTDGGEGNVTDEGFTHLVIGVDAFTSIQDAIDAVAEDGVVNVLPGTYEEGGDPGDYSLRIITDGISVQGVNHDGTPIEDYESENIPVIEGQSFYSTGISYRVDADNVTLSGLRILPQPNSSNWGAYVLRVYGGNFTLENCLIDDVEGSNGNVYALTLEGEGVISAHIEDNRLEGSIVLLDGAGTGSVFKNNQIFAVSQAHFGLSKVPGVPSTVTIEGNSFLGSHTGNLVYSYDLDDIHPPATWMFDVFGNNDVGEAYAIVKDMDTLELREVSSSVYGYSTFLSALNHAQAGDTIFSFLPVADDGTIALNFDPDDMPEDSSLVMIELHGPPIFISIPVAGFDSGGTHTASAQLADDDGDLPIPEGYDFLVRLVLTIEGPGVTDGQFVDGSPAQILVVDLPEGIDADSVLLLRYNEVTEEWEVQEKEIDEYGTVIFTTPQWSDFVFVLDAEDETPEPGTGELPATGTAVMWLIPFGALLLLAGWGLRKRAVA